MTLDRGWMLGVASAEREALGRTVQYTPPERWDAESPVDGWRVRDVVAHLASSDAAAAALVGDEASAEVEEYRASLERGREFRLADFNRWAVSRRAEAGAIALASEWGRAANLLLSRVSATSDGDWTERRVSWIAGELKLGDLVQARVAQWWIHGEDIRAGGGLPPRMEHPSIFCVNDLAIRLLPYALGLAGASFPGASVEVELEAVGGGRWLQALAPGAVPPAGAAPTVYVTGRAHQFALVASHRADVDVYLYDGVLNAGGDPEVAEAVLHALRAFI